MQRSNLTSPTTSLASDRSSTASLHIKLEAGENEGDEINFKISGKTKKNSSLYKLLQFFALTSDGNFDYTELFLLLKNVTDGIDYGKVKSVLESHDGMLTQLCQRDEKLDQALLTIDELRRHQRMQQDTLSTLQSAISRLQDNQGGPIYNFDLDQQSLPTDMSPHDDQSMFQLHPSRVVPQQLRVDVGPSKRSSSSREYRPTDDGQRFFHHPPAPASLPPPISAHRSISGNNPTDLPLHLQWLQQQQPHQYSLPTSPLSQFNHPPPVSHGSNGLPGSQLISSIPGTRMTT
jgi:hypothetical protein